MDRQVKRTAYLSLLAALCCAASMVIAIPTPIGGYLNAGDIIVVLTALLAGPLYGGVAMGLGAALADLFAGFALFAPGTLLAKGLAAAVVGALYRKTGGGKTRALAAAVCGEVVMAAVYFVYEAACLRFGLAAAAELPGNLLQGAVGAVGGTALFQALRKVPEVQELQTLTTRK